MLMFNCWGGRREVEILIYSNILELETNLVSSDIPRATELPEVSILFFMRIKFIRILRLRISEI